MGKGKGCGEGGDGEVSGLSVITTVLFIVDSFVMLGFLFVPQIRRRILREVIRDALEIVKEGGQRKKKEEEEWSPS